MRGPSSNPGGSTIYAIVRAGGKQYRVEAEQVLDVDRIQADVGSTVELNDVLLLGGAGDVRIGTPIVDGARVLAEVIEHGRDKKILVFKYKNKTRYRRRHGHRQDFTRLAIREILTEGQQATAVAEKPKRPARKKAAPSAEATPPPTPSPPKPPPPRLPRSQSGLPGRRRRPRPEHPPPTPSPPKRRQLQNRSPVAPGPRSRRPKQRRNLHQKQRQCRTQRRKRHPREINRDGS